MVRNNLLSIFFHIILGVAGYNLLFLTLQGIQVFIVAAILLLLYFIGGYFLMTPQQNNKKNLVSVSLVSLILIGTAIICSLISIKPTQSIEWIIYAFANAPMISLLFQDQSDQLFLVYAYAFSCVPSLALWMGLNLKRKNAH